MSKKYVTEEDLLEMLGITHKQTGCCTSCHEDHDMGYDMCEIRYKGNLVYVCCDVYRAVRQFDEDA